MRFTPLTAPDLPLVTTWRAAPHVSRWLGPAPTEEQVAAKYLPRIRGEVPTRCFLAWHEGAPFAFVQGYRAADHPVWAAVCGLGADVAGLDLFIGEPGHLGRGIGAATIDGFVTTVLLTWPGIDASAANPLSSNVASVRAFARAGFTPMREIHDPADLRPSVLLLRQGR
ncbi:MAG: GNAT family N-acetyltransferase [Myxococcota bacterium]